MNLAQHLHLLTGRMRKARRREARYRIRAGGWWVPCLVWCFSPTRWLPIVLQVVLFALTLLFWYLGARSTRYADVYQRVVDRCQGALLTILAVQRWQHDSVIAEWSKTDDKRRWS